MSREAWQKFLKGDENAFSDLYSFYLKELFAYGLKIGFNEDECKDAIQDVFFNIYISRKKLSHVQNIEFYLLQSLKNKLFDFHNRETKINRINYEDIFINNEDGIVEQIINKEKQLEVKNIISQFLQKLPPKQRKIIYYHYQLNLNIEEIATILEMTTPAVKKSLYRALQKIKETSSDITQNIFTHFLTIIG